MSISEGTTDGKLPTNASLKMMNWDETKAKSTATEAKADHSLGILQTTMNSVNVDYNMFLTVNVNYKGCIEQG